MPDEKASCIRNVLSVCQTSVPFAECGRSVGKRLRTETTEMNKKPNIIYEDTKGNEKNREVGSVYHLKAIHILLLPHVPHSIRILCIIIII